MENRSVFFRVEYGTLAAFSKVIRAPFLCATGTATGRITSYEIDGETGALMPLDHYAVGRRPAVVLAVPVGR